VRPLGKGWAAVGGRGAFEDGAAAGFAHREWQIQRTQERFVLENHSAFDGVLELANISGQLWPRIRRRVSSVMPRIDFLNRRL